MPIAHQFVCYFIHTFSNSVEMVLFFIYMQNMHPGEYCLRKAGVLVEPAWLWYFFLEVWIREETEIGLKSTKQTRISAICDEEEAVQLVKYVRKLDVESISHMIGDHQTFHTQTSMAAYISAQQWWWDDYDDWRWWWWWIEECNVIVYSSEKVGTTCRVNLCIMSWLRMDWKMQVWEPSKNKKNEK